MDFTPWLFTLNLLMVLKVTLGIDKELSCAVCRALVDEVNYSISKVDPKKKIQVGSFRVDSRGNQGTYEKSYARSEIHLIDVFENICDNFKNYAETTNDAGQNSVGRIKARPGNTLALTDNIKISAESQKILKYNCETLLEDYEEEIIAILAKENHPDVEDAICVDITSRCSKSDLQTPMPVTEFASMDDIIKDAEKDQEKPDETENKSKTDEEDILAEYLKDTADNIQADSVIDVKPIEESIEGIQTDREEL